ncbi:glycoside hydrolase family 55 protein [Caldicoprobacter algeriensis]|uniref:glycoside hydrolase family 55 protein n=1 Tax=Caldicoprobacter algeriensis TaxID=699281 RepID=UPI00207AF783|nr:glycoside hydrolase family 55 protein [Caldicoprobacter algeriensis]MCM8900626.1 glycoside hydrolase family 55 protein [Caldicoprobacter algeriensis]
MASISDKVQQIRQAVYGKDVRESIASGIEAINEEVESTTARQASLETTFEQLIINAGNSNAEIVDARGGFDTLRKKLDSYAINVKDFGAKGDGVADDTAAIQAAVDAAAAAGGLEVLLPYGQYKITSSIVLKKGVTIRGVGWVEPGETFSGSKIWYYGTDYCFQYHPDASLIQVRAPKFYNLYFVSSNGGGFCQLNPKVDMAVPPNPQPVAHILNPIIERCRILRYPYADDADTSIGLSMTAAFFGCFKNVHFAGWALAVDLHCSDLNHFEDCQFTNCRQWLNITYKNTYGSQNKFTHCDFEIRNTAAANYWMIKDSGRYTTYEDCYFEPGTQPEIYTCQGIFDFATDNEYVDTFRNIRRIINCRFDLIGTGEQIAQSLIKVNQYSRIILLTGNTIASRLTNPAKMVSPLYTPIVPDENIILYGNSLGFNTWFDLNNNRIGSNYTACITANADQSIPHDTVTKLTLPTTIFDYGMLHDVANSRLVIKEGGRYLIIGSVQFYNNGTGLRDARIYVNGSLLHISRMQAVAADAPTHVIVTTLAKLERDDYVELFVKQTSGAALTIPNAGLAGPILAIVKVG